MRVNPNKEATGVSPTPVRPAPQEPSLGTDDVSLSTSESLNTALQNTPATRAEKVSEAKALIEDGSYPPEVLIRKISALLADHLNASEQAP